jgi:saccharopine dehydrogenase (NAD+, L-lysine-forming)
VTNVFCAYAQKHLFDTIETIDIMDANAGDHGYKFATNFNPEIDIREITQRGRFWEKGEWKETDPLYRQVGLRLPRGRPEGQLPASTTRNSSPSRPTSRA